MKSNSTKVSAALFAVFACFAESLPAESAELDRAIETYYAGHPQQAIEMIRPLAMSGDAEAQFLLGNILYSLSKSGRPGTGEDPVKWYRMAARQDSAQASYALGVIHNNDWIKWRREEDARAAEAYFQKAADLGFEKALAPLARLSANSRAKRKRNSLTYSNSSFSSKRKASAKVEKDAQQPALDKALSGFRSSDNPASDAMKLLALLKETGYIDDSKDESRPTGGWPDETAITRLLRGIESADEIVSELVNLLGSLDSSRNPPREAGSN
jgi:hypothetical protein